MAPQYEYGIKELYRPPNGEPDVDIVAVHGLNGGIHKTWTSEKNKVCWLNDPEFLPKYIKNARVLAWGYNASFSRLRGDDVSKSRIHQHAETLVAQLGADRRLSGTSDKPIIFICHSLGGIIVKRALSYAQTRTGYKVSRDYNIFASTHSILFFGTPHHGSSLAHWLDFIKKAGAAVTPHSLGGMVKSDLVSALATESETLQNITSYFVPMMRHFNIFFFWEQKRTNLGMARDFIVSQESAAPVYDETERAGIAADHSGMVKFEDPSSPGFRMVMEALLRYYDEAPDVIRQRRANADHTLRMERDREVAETLRRTYQPQVEPRMPPRVQSGLESFTIIDRTASFRSLQAPEEVKM